MHRNNREINIANSDVLVLQSIHKSIPLLLSLKHYNICHLEKFPNNLKKFLLNSISAIGLIKDL